MIVKFFFLYLLKLNLIGTRGSTKKRGQATYIAR
jgi:hypothetical protein